MSKRRKHCRAPRPEPSTKFEEQVDGQKPAADDVLRRADCLPDDLPQKRPVDREPQASDDGLKPHEPLADDGLSSAGAERLLRLLVDAGGEETNADNADNEELRPSVGLTGNWT